MRGAEVPVRRLPRPVRLLGLVGCCSGAASRGPALPLGCWPPGRVRLPVFLWVRFPCRCRGALAQGCLALGGHRRASRLPVLGSGALLRMGPRDGVRTAHCLPLVAHASPSPVAPDRVLWSTTPGVPPSPGGPVTLVHGTVSLRGRGVAAPPSPGGSATLVHGAVPPSPDGPVTLVLGTVGAPGLGSGCGAVTLSQHLLRRPLLDGYSCPWCSSCLLRRVHRLLLSTARSGYAAWVLVPWPSGGACSCLCTGPRPSTLCSTVSCRPLGFLSGCDHTDCGSSCSYCSFGRELGPNPFVLYSAVGVSGAASGLAICARAAAGARWTRRSQTGARD